MQHHLIFMSTTPGYVSIPWGKQNLLHFLSVQMVPLRRFLCIWTWSIHIYAILYKSCSSGYRHTGSESMRIFSFTRKANFPFPCTCVPVVTHNILEPFYWAFWYMLGLKNHCQYCLSGMVFLTCSIYKCWWTFFKKIFYKELFSFACVSGAYVTISIVSIYVVLCIVLKYVALQ